MSQVDQIIEEYGLTQHRFSIDEPGSYIMLARLSKKGDVVNYSDFIKGHPDIVNFFKKIYEVNYSRPEEVNALSEMHLLMLNRLSKFQNYISDKKSLKGIHMVVVLERDEGRKYFPISDSDYVIDDKAYDEYIEEARVMRNE